MEESKKKDLDNEAGSGLSPLSIRTIQVLESLGFDPFKILRKESLQNLTREAIQSSPFVGFMTVEEIENFLGRELPHNTSACPTG